MNAIADAARLGRSVKNAKLYVTTFPCHNCAKHIIASGIKEVVFIEPYPKSRTGLLYGHLISDTPSPADSIIFRPFTGISPRRYSDIFEKGSRRGADGNINEWYLGHPTPLLGHPYFNYIEPEKRAIRENWDVVSDN